MHFVYVCSVQLSSAQFNRSCIHLRISALFWVPSNLALQRRLCAASRWNTVYSIVARRHTLADWQIDTAFEHNGAPIDLEIRQVNMRLIVLSNSN
jgi:hypothetical protein